MNSLGAAMLVNLLGFTVGAALYALLLAMVVRHRKTPGPENINYLLIATAVLGLVWNLGQLFAFIQKDFGTTSGLPLIDALSYSALGFLPSVVVYSAQDPNSRRKLLTFGAYGLSVFASLMHFYAAIAGHTTPSDIGLQSLTIGSVVLAASVLLFNFRQTLEKKAIWAAGLLIFALSAFHLSSGAAENFWLVELVAHQTSLPLALVILYQNYRFAFADLFLKRAISLMLLSMVAFALYIGIAAPLLRYHETHDRNDVQAVSIILTLWIATALIYPHLHKLAVWLVDRVILKRADYVKFQNELARRIETTHSTEPILDLICERLGSVLTAGRAGWAESYEPAVDLGVNTLIDSVKTFVITTETPFYELTLSDFSGGRRLLSEEIAMFESVATGAARRIDALRVTNERYEREFREQEFLKLAAEAQLTALRSQINPHFLFNALTTIGYLIQTSPDKAFQTLLHLTKLLRGVLKSTSEFCTLGDELRLIESYLDIERARFEERLSVEIDVAESLNSIEIPALILQPLVENAIKHGISESRAGGTITITAKLEHANDGPFLILTVTNTGSAARSKLDDTNGLGLKSIRARLRAHYGSAAGFELEIGGANGTRAVVKIPVSNKVPMAVRSRKNREPQPTKL